MSGQDERPRVPSEMEATVFHVPRPELAAAIAQAGGRIRVEVLGGPMDGLRARTDEQRLLIGRANDNDLCLALDPGASSRHACIGRVGNSYWLEDLDSRNGTYLGEERLRGRTPVSPGTTFTVGRTQIQFMPR